MVKFLLCLVFWWGLSHKISSAQTGFPETVHYLAKDYGAGSQNWQIKKDRFGIIWIANNSGLISFDGYRFETYQNKNASIVRSFDFGKNDTIWIGSTSEIGFLKKNKWGHYSYEKIAHEQDSSIHFSDVWKTFYTPEGVVFFTIEGYLLYKDGKLTQLKTSPYSMASIWDGIVLHHNEKGISILARDSLDVVLHPDLFDDQPILSVVPISKNEAYVFSYKYGISTFTKDENNQIKHHLINDFKPASLPDVSIYDVIHIKETEFVLATLDAGIFHFDIKSGIKKNYIKKNSIHNNSITSVLVDKNRIWFTSDNGFGAIELDSPVGLFGEKNGIDGRVEDIWLDESDFIVGGLSGLFRFNTPLGEFQPVLNKDVSVQVWDVTKHKQNIYAGTDAGLIKLTNRSFEFINKEYYVRSVESFGSDLILGLGGAVQIAKEVKDKVQFGPIYSEKLASDIVSILVLSNEVVFLVDASNELFRLTFSSNHFNLTHIEKIEKKHNWKTNSTIDIQQVDGVLYALSDEGLFEWSEQKQQFTKKWFEGGKSKAFYINKNWVFLDTLSRTDKYLRFYSYQNEKKYFLNEFGTIPRVQINSYLVKNKIIYLSTSDGVYTLDFNKNFKNDKPNIFITDIKGTSIDINLGLISQTDTVLFEYPYLSENNSLTFNLGSSNYSFSNKTKFQFALESSDKEPNKWSIASSKPELTFSNLSWNTYYLHIRTIDAFDVNSETFVARFNVNKPWYVSFYGMIVWFVLFAGIVSSIVVWRTKIVEKREIKKADEKLDRERQKAALKEAEYKAQVAEQESIRKTKELDEAREIQQQFLPQKLPNARFLDFAAMQRTASEVGGDYYDFFDRGEQIWVAAVGDATGHGVGAGLMVSATKASLLTIDEKNLSKIGILLNKVLKTVNKNKRLNMALLLLEFIPQNDGSILLEICGGGMPPIIVLRNTGAIEEIIIEGLPFGVMSLAEYPTRSVKLFPNDTIVVYSDGLPERPNPSGEQLGYEEMMKLFEQLNQDIISNKFSFSASDILKKIEFRSDELAQNEPLDDDLTMMVTKIKSLN